jgi:hypothetical protein
MPDLEIEKNGELHMVIKPLHPKPIPSLLIKASVVATCEPSPFVTLMSRFADVHGVS